MSRSGFIFGMSGPAAILTLLAQPVVRQAADGMTPPPAAASMAIAGETTLRALQPVAFQVAFMPRSERPAAQSPASDLGRSVTEKEPVKTRRLMRDGCEGAISSLAGPEARRMVPGRCIS